MLKDRTIEVKENVKNHIKRNEKKYIVLGIVVISGVSFYFGKRSSIKEITKIKTIISGHGNNFITMHNWSGTNRPGGLSYMVRCKETGDIWMTQHGAALSHEVSDTNMSKHLKHGEPIPGLDLTFERVGIAA
jgi:hypothetical protein